MTYPPPKGAWCCDHSCDNCSGIDPASCINHAPHTPPADVCLATRSGDACIKAAGHDGLHAYKADVCDNPDCENGTVTRVVEGVGSAVPFPCPSCGGTGDRPAVTDAEVEAALHAHMVAHGFRPPTNDDRVGPAYEHSRDAMRAALEAAAATRPAPAVTDEQVDAATDALLPLLTSWSAKQRREVARAALEAAAARQELTTTDRSEA